MAKEGGTLDNRSMSARARLFVALVSTCLVGYIALGSVLGRVLGDDFGTPPATVMEDRKSVV